mgnify:CR=1 FL=1
MAKKQTETNESFSLGSSKTPESKSRLKNLAKASKQFKKTTPTSKTPKEKPLSKTMMVRVHKDTANKFLELHHIYSNYIFRIKKDFSLKIDNKEFFKIVVDYWKGELLGKKKYFEAPEEFVSMLHSQRRRKINERTVIGEDAQRLGFGLTMQTYTDYLSLIYSYLENHPKNDISLYSCSYFFYDFIEYIEQNMEEIKKNS